MIQLKNIFILNVLLILTACSAAGVPYTNDPFQKLQYATELYDKYNRPLPAQRMIFEALETFKQNNNEFGIAKAYRTYAFFLQSPAVGKFEPAYRKSGFKDKTVNFDNRYKKAIEYFEKTASIYKKLAKYDQLSNIYLSMSSNYFLVQNNNLKACNYLDKSLNSHLNHKKNNPDDKVFTHSKFKTFSGYIKAVKIETKCN